MSREDLRPHLHPVFDATAAALRAGQSVLLVGAPGVGKTMMARRLTNYTVSGALLPWRAPHHTCSPAGMFGGGSPPRKGEVSLADGGLLFLDDVPEFSIQVLDGVKRARIEKRIEVSPLRDPTVFPADFALLGAANPCPCGWFGIPERACTCPQKTVERYLARIPKGMFDVTIAIPSS
jgi:magnesium chelatase family protein